jgi:flagellar secretion chaperone FliS
MSLEGYAQYQQNQLLTASPAKLLLAAYDGAIKFCRMADEKMAERDYEEQNKYINKALAIVCELLATLREDVDPLLVRRLRSLYNYVIEKLARANLASDPAALGEAIKILTDLRGTWAQAALIVQQEHQEEAA